MGAWVENRFEDRANAVMRMVILREYTPPDPLSNLNEEQTAAEWVFCYLRSLGIDGEPRDIVIRYVRDIGLLREMVAGQPKSEDGGK